mgnify:CR=1 FL=1
MSKITDSSLENLFTVNSHYVMDSLEEAVNFDGKTEEQREEIVRTALKSLEIATIMTCKFFDSETFDADKIMTIATELKNENFSKANDIVAQDS